MVRIGAHIKGLQVGVARQTRGMDTGLMGIGLGNTTTATDYPNIIDQLALQNITNSRAFSLDLGSVDTPEGKSHFPLLNLYDTYFW